MLVQLCSAQLNGIAAAIARSHKGFFGATKCSDYQQLNESACLENGAGTFNNSLINST